QGAPRGDDALGEVLGCVVLGRRHRPGGDWCSDQQAAAGGAELLARRGGLAAVWALELQPGAAVLTEPRALRVLCIALRALHRRPPLASGGWEPPAPRW